jgi:hypothetical protein
MVDHSNPQNFASSHQSRSDLMIFPAGCGIAAGVIVNQHEGRCSGAKSGAEDLAGVNETCGEGPL